MPHGEVPRRLRRQLPVHAVTPSAENVRPPASPPGPTNQLRQWNTAWKEPRLSRQRNGSVHATSRAHVTELAFQLPDSGVYGPATDGARARKKPLLDAGAPLLCQSYISSVVPLGK